jgi:cell division transport system permease protein
VAHVAQVPRTELTRLLGPWLGNEAGEDDLPVPALIDVRLTQTRTQGSDGADLVRRIVAPIEPAVRVDAQGAALAGTETLLRAVTLLAAAIVTLMIGAGIAMVLLSIRAGLAAHETTIDVMHRLGATDAQVARLFCRRMARDAALAAAIGAPTAWGALVLLGQVGAGTGAELLGGMTLGRVGWGSAIILPVAFVALAALVAYIAVRRALGRLV